MHDSLKQLRWFIYARKSEDDKDKQVQSIQGQLDDLESLQLKLGGLQVIATFTEEQSAKAPGRPKFTDMIRRIQKGEADGILIWAYHRLSRNPIDDGTIQWLLQNGIVQAIKTIDRIYLPGDNALLLRIEGGTANQFILDLQKNVKRGLKQKLEKGWKPGQAVLGYLNTKTELRGENYIIKDPERFSLMRKAWDLMLTGKYTPPQILKVMNEDWGMRTRKTRHQGNKSISRSSIYRMFTNTFYTGLFYYKGQLYPGKHEAMITLDEFDRVQMLLGRYGRPRPQKHTFTYTGTMTCGVCGSAITAVKKKKVIKSTGEVKSYTFYYCTRHKKSDVPCTQNKYVTVQQLEGMIISFLHKHTITEEFRDWAVNVIYNEYGAVEDQQHTISRSQEQAIVSTQKEIENLISLRLRDLIDDTIFITRKSELQKEIIVLDWELKEAKKNTWDWKQYLQERFDFACTAGKRFKDGTEDEKKTIFCALGWNYKLKDQKLFITKVRWLEVIEKIRDILNAKIGRLEPKNKLCLQGQYSAFEPTRPLLRSLIDEVRTHPPEDGESDPFLKKKCR